MAELDPEAKLALDELFARLYDRVRQLAARVRWSSDSQTLNPTALVHEAYLKLLKSPADSTMESRDEVIAVLATAMRQILVDAARRKNALKRIPAPEPDRAGLPSEDIFTLNAIVDVLRRENPRQGRLVDCRFYLGMTVEESATALGMSRTAVEREWRVTRAWLEDRLQRKEAAT